MNDRNFQYQPKSMKELNSFEELFRLYYPRMRNYACNFLQDTGEAEDMVQDVFYEVWKSGKKLDSEKNVGSFLFTVLRNKCLNVLRHKVVEEQYVIQKSRCASESLYHLSFRDTGEFVSMEERLMEELAKIISQMPEKCRKAFRLKWFEEKKIHEIAEIMNISTTMVDKHLAKGLKIARERLNPDLFIFFMARFEGGGITSIL